MCSKPDLQIGPYWIQMFSNCSCDNCGSNELPTGKFDAYYHGHIVENGIICHYFELISDVYCPSCGVKLINIKEACGGGNYFQLEQVKQNETYHQHT